MDDTGSGCCDGEGVLTCGFDDALKKTMVLAATRPTTAADGVDITSWRDVDGCAPSVFQLFLDGTAPCIINGLDSANGVELFGYVTVDGVGKWRWIPYVHNGAPIPILSAAIGWLQEMQRLGLYERLSIVGVPTAGVVTATFIPLKRRSL